MTPFYSFVKLFKRFKKLELCTFYTRVIEKFPLVYLPKKPFFRLCFNFNTKHYYFFIVSV